MRHVRLLSRFWGLVGFAVMAVLLAGCIGGDGDKGAPGDAAASALRRSFPEQAGKVLEQGAGVVASGDRFVFGRDAERGTRLEVKMELPREASGAIRFLRSNGGEIRVREVGVEGSGEIAEHAVAYRRRGGTSFWAAVPGGAEEWLHLEASAVRAGEAVASWEVEGATVRQAGEAVELVDAAGWVRMRVTAPSAYAVRKSVVKTRVEGRVGKVNLYVEWYGEEVLIDPLWVAVTPMAAARQGHTATLLGNGKVLVAGGADNPNGPASTELYDPLTALWSAATPMNAGRIYHTATLLGNGNILVVGGIGQNGQLSSAELYDPSTNAWSSAGSMGDTRYFHTATLLTNGKVLVAGGFGFGTSIASVELYNPATNLWTMAPSMSFPRSQHTATLLGSGKVLVTSGYTDPQANTELYDPATNVWMATGFMNVNRDQHAATLLENGKVLVVGGDYPAFTDVSSAELYDPSTALWSPAGKLGAYRRFFTVTLLGNGKVLAAGGDFSDDVHASAELYDPAINDWMEAGSMSVARRFHTTTLLANGNVLVAGGSSDNAFVPLASADLFMPEVSKCTQPGDCPSGFCADGFCCDAECNAGACDSCSIATGARTNGICTLLTDTPCQGGKCQSGTCVTDSDAGTDAGAEIDTDSDGIPDSADNCPTIFNPDQANQDQDALGDVCDDDRDGDSKPNATDNCPTISNPGQEDKDNNGIGDACDCDKPDGTPCDDGDLCTTSDLCKAGKCIPMGAVTCPKPGICQTTQCLPHTGGCPIFNKTDGAPCKDANDRLGICIAGACYTEEAPSSTSTSASASASGAGTGVGATGGGGSPVTTSIAASASSGAGPGAGAGGSNNEEISFGGGACGACAVGREPPGGAPLLGLGFLLALRRRRRASASPFRTG